MSLLRRGLTVFVLSILLQVLVSEAAWQNTCSKSIAIDFGNSWIKTALVNPQGKVLKEIVVNEQAERKTPAFIGFDTDGDVQVGETAQRIAVKNPSHGFGHIKRLIGKTFTSPASSSYQAGFGAHLKLENVNGAPAFKVGDEKYGIDELVTLVLQSQREITSAQLFQAFGKRESVDKAVLIVPDYFTKSQRELYAEIATAAGLDSVLLVSETTASGIEYALTAIKAGESTNIVVFNAGAFGASASLLSLSKNDKGELTVKVLKRETDATSGALEADVILAKLIAKKFMRPTLRH